jgi:Flp pilus assembly protein TadB
VHNAARRSREDARAASTIGWLLFLLLIAALIVFAITRLFEFPTLWVFALPLAFGVAAWLLAHLDRSLASRKRFEYHYKPDFASWLEGGARKTYPPNRDVEAAAAKSPDAPCG